MIWEIDQDYSLTYSSVSTETDDSLVGPKDYGPLGNAIGGFVSALFDFLKDLKDFIIRAVHPSNWDDIVKEFIGGVIYVVNPFHWDDIKIGIQDNFMSMAEEHGLSYAISYTIGSILPEALLIYYTGGSSFAKKAGKADDIADAGRLGSKVDDLNLKHKSEDVRLGSDTKPSQKLINQMERRGWSEESFRETIDSPYTTRKSKNLSTGNDATVYYKEDGSYIIVDDVTNEVVQVSDANNPEEWIPDSNIIDPYMP